MSGLSTHVLDATSGSPADGMRVALLADDRAEIDAATTDADGRIANLGGDRLPPGTYHLLFASGPWFGARGVAGFYPEIDVCFSIEDPDRHHHVPILLSPFAYSTYRGS